MHVPAIDHVPLESFVHEPVLDSPLPPSP